MNGLTTIFMYLQYSNIRVMKGVESKKGTENMFDIYTCRAFSELEYTFQSFQLHSANK